MTRRISTTLAARAAGGAALMLLVACDGPQSALRYGGTDAAQLGRLWYVMIVGAVVLWIAVNGLFYWVTRIRTQAMSRRLAEGVIIGGGIVFPLVILTTLLVYALSIMPDQRAPGDGLRVRVTGEQWWWRVEYWPEGAEAPVVSANELRLPAGRRSEIELTSARVIHSLWIPSLGGKTDMFPGKVNRMSLEPVEPGTYRGQCAEFCGLSHALMAFQTVVMEEDAFADWLDAQAAGQGGAAFAAASSAGAAPTGADIFFREGCGACHAIRGTEAEGQVGPDLTHFGDRVSLAAGILPMERDALERWIAAPDAIKPGAEMPRYDHLSGDELRTLADWLMGLE